MTEKQKAKIRRMYFYADLKPLQIWKITGVKPHIVYEVIYGKHSQKH